MSFNKRFCDWNPNFGIGHDVIAAYWHDIDFRDSVGGFYASMHESTATDAISVKLFNQTNQYLQKYANVTNFSPTTVILGTWYKGTPYPYYNYLDKIDVISSFLTFLILFYTSNISFV